VPQYTELVLLSLAPPDSARLVLARDLHAVYRGSTPFQRWPLWTWDAPFWSAIGDTASLREAVRDGDSTLSTTADPALRRFAQLGTRSARAHLALARHDTGQALEQFVSTPDTLRTRWDDLTTARLLARRGRASEALRWLEVVRSDGDLSSGDVLLALERARVTERLGKRRDAEWAYGFVAGMWMHADPELQPYVREARAALTRLAAR
jgi:hypothetical protein